MVKLKKSDFGGEIISILTKGMYSDPRDALREYIQNGVDAKAKNVSVKIRHRNIIIQDDGKGMPYDTMRKAIRIGISDKNPKANVGFMGIGIYSSFHLCDKLTIYSKVKNGVPNKLTFHFKRMRELLEEQREARLKNEINDEAIIALQALIEDHLELTQVDENEFPTIGTTVEMEGVESEFFRTLSKFEEVANYLEQVIPLPFHPNFKWGKEIEKKIAEICRKHDAQFELINLNLTINERSEDLFRPYSDNDFEPEPLEPKFIELKKGKEFYGVAWGCLNASRNTIKNKELRGFLIRKQGFAVGKRDNLIKYFNRQTYFNRYIGEVIVVHPQILPNAPRSDFEFSLYKIDLEECLRDAASNYNDYANVYQETTKSHDKINEAIDFAKETTAQLNYYADNSEKLAEILWQLKSTKESLEKRQKKGHVSESKKDDYKKVISQIKELTTEVKKLIQNKSKKKRKKTEKRANSKVAQEIEKIPKKEETYQTVYNDLIEVVESMGIDLTEDLRNIFRTIDEDFIQSAAKDKEDYLNKLKQLRQNFEDSYDE